jgi:hypothetical protein
MTGNPTRLAGRRLLVVGGGSQTLVVDGGLGNLVTPF